MVRNWKTNIKLFIKMKPTLLGLNYNSCSYHHGPTRTMWIWIMTWNNQRYEYKKQVSCNPSKLSPHPLLSFFWTINDKKLNNDWILIKSSQINSYTLWILEILFENLLGNIFKLLMTREKINYQNFLPQDLD